jgi:hypothetical protein
MPDVVSCPECYRKLKVDDRTAKRGVCPHCGADLSDSNDSTYSLEDQTKPKKNPNVDKKPSHKEDETDSDESPRRQRRSESKPSKPSPRDRDDEDDEKNDDEAPRKRRGDSKPSKPSQGDDDEDDDEVDEAWETAIKGDKTARKWRRRVRWMRSLYWEVVVCSIGFAMYVLFMLLSFIWPSLAVLSLCIAALGAVAFCVLYYAAILDEGGLGALALYLFLPFWGLYFFFQNFEGLGKILLLFLICCFGVYGAHRRMQSADQVNFAQNNNTGAKANPGVGNPFGPRRDGRDDTSKPRENPRVSEKGISYLSDLDEFDFVPGMAAFGWTFGKDGDLGDSVHSPIQVDGIRYTKGLGMHPPPSSKKYTEISYTLDEKALKLRGYVALNDTSERAESPLYFEVLGDGRSLWKSKPIQKKSDIQGFDIPVNRQKLIRLRVSVAGSTNDGCHAVWLDPYIKSN